MSDPSFDIYSIRTESDAFTPKYETLGADFFDDYLKLNPSTIVEHDYSVLSDPNFSRSVSGNSGSADTPASSVDDDIKHQIRNDEAENQVWTEDLTIPQGYSIYTGSSGRAAISENEILSLEDITLHSPHTCTPFQPSFSQSAYDTATFLRRPSCITDTPSKSSRNASTYVAQSLRNPIRKASSFPMMTRASQRSVSDIWSTNHGLNPHGQTGSMSSIPPGSKTPKNFIPGGFNDIPYVNDMSQSYPTGFFDFDTPLPTPVSSVQSVRRSKSELQESDNAMFTQTPDSDYISHEWSQMITPSTPYADDTSSICASGVDSPIWWNHATAAPMAQPSPTSLHVNPRRATRSLAVQLHDTVSHTANALPCRPSSMTTSRMIQTTEISSEQSFASNSTMIQDYNSTHSPSQYLPHVEMEFCDPSPRKPRLVRKPRFGPDDLEPPSPSPSPELHVRKRKSSRQNRQSMPRSPAPGESAGFVNYTPDDSRKILTGVAPSGSSKTKARREKEALEKRRKLSQAAVRAVRAAGGDVNALAEEGLFA